MITAVPISRSLSRPTRRPRPATFVLALDAVLILLPVSLIAGLGGFFIVLGGIASLGTDRDPEMAIAVIATLLSLLATGALWAMVVTELFNSPADDEDATFFHRWMHIGAGIAVLAWFVPSLGPLAMGTPLLVPYVHVQIHRALRMRATARDSFVEQRGQP